MAYPGYYYWSLTVVIDILWSSNFDVVLYPLLGEVLMNRQNAANSLSKIFSFAWYGGKDMVRPMEMARKMEMEERWRWGGGGGGGDS
jgi:hypothetical protein